MANRIFSLYILYILAYTQFVCVRASESVSCIYERRRTKYYWCPIFFFSQTLIMNGMRSWMVSAIWNYRHVHRAFIYKINWRCRVTPSSFVSFSVHGHNNNDKKSSSLFDCQAKNDSEWGRQQTNQPYEHSNRISKSQTRQKATVEFNRALTGMNERVHSTECLLKISLPFPNVLWCGVCVCENHILCLCL